MGDYPTTSVNSMGIVKENDCPVANYIMENGFYLPSGLNLNEEDIKYICNCIKDIQKNALLGKK